MTRTSKSNEELAKIVKEAKSMADVLRALGLRMTGGSHYHYSKRVKKLGLDTSHWTRAGHNKGKTFPLKRRSSGDILVKSSSDRREHAHLLRRAMQEMGVLYQCSECGTASWQGKKLVLDVDHINGDWTDHRLENLRFLCPNCHSQTTTFGSKKRSPI